MSEPSFGGLLRTLREGARLSQEALAERAGLSTRTVSDLERGVNKTARRFTADLLAGALRLEGDDHERFLAAAAGRSAPDETPPHSGGERPTPEALIGRHDEFVECQRALREGARLLTLTGPGGVGKTRLARELMVAPTHVAEAVFVDLSSLEDPDLVASVVARALGLADSPETLLRNAATSLADRHDLIVLDNAEHVLDATTAVARALMSTSLVTVVTSRTPLRLTGEHVVDVRPLPANDAAALFMVRAEAATGRRVTASDAVTVAEICQRLDGLPLPIELAAARSRLLTPSELLARLDLDLLAIRSTGAPERQRTMRALVGWSYDLLNGDEQEVFAACSVFRGGFDVASASRVVGRDCLDDLEALLDASLLTVQSDGERSRLRMLETIAQYAAEQLAARPDADDPRQRHVGWCLDLAARAGEALTGPDQAVWLDRLHVEHDNLRSALSQSLAVPDDPRGRAVRIAAGLWRFWYLHGHLSEGRRWLDQVLALPAPADHDIQVAYATAQYGAGVITWLGGDLDRASDLAQRATEHLAQLDQRGLAASAQMLVGMIAQYRGDAVAAGEQFRAALQVGRELSDQRVIAVALINLGALATDAGDDASGARLLEESLTEFRALGDTRSTADVLGTLGEIATRQGRLDDAAALFSQCLSAFLELGDRPGESECRQALARLATQGGDAAEAASQWDAVLQISADIADPWGRAAARTGFAILAEQADEPVAADRYVHALDLNRDLDHRAGMVACLEGLVRLAERTCDEPAALRWRGELAAVNSDGAARR
ncbi:MAG: tetratricopeptide repeat protein [Frankiaceae bacterium]|nr:tetratricopeptide repeat protein [Frankiaceae bacterium]MBV9872178.1 tetratricopeptide repeat protein [Frankiaceae bacterium]